MAAARVSEELAAVAAVALEVAALAALDRNTTVAALVVLPRSDWLGVGAAG